MSNYLSGTFGGAPVTIIDVSTVGSDTYVAYVDVSGNLKASRLMFQSDVAFSTTTTVIGTSASGGSGSISDTGVTSGVYNSLFNILVNTKGQVLSAYSPSLIGVVFSNGAGSVSALPLGSVGQVLTVVTSGAAWATAAAGGTAANPTGTIGLAAVNGVSATYMRSDATPALSQSIAPTWSGIHRFNAPTGFGAASIASIMLYVAPAKTVLTGASQYMAYLAGQFDATVTTTRCAGLYIAYAIDGNATVPNNYGLRIYEPDMTNSALITNNYGQKIEDITIGTNKWAFKSGLGLMEHGDKFNVSGTASFADGIKIREGSNATMGVVTLTAGTATVSTTKVTANSRIQLTPQNLGTITVPVGLAISARSAGTNFTILSGNLADTSIIAWEITEPIV